MKRIFISYKHEPKSEAFSVILRDRLRSWGYTTWRDVDDIPPGASWPDAIYDALLNSHTVVGIMTKLALRSEEVREEWFFPIMNDRQLILLWMEDINFPIHQKFAMRQRIDFRADHERGFGLLKDALAHQPETNGVATVDDPYDEYVKDFYRRINTILKQSLLHVLARDHDPTPIQLKMDVAPEQVLLAKKDAVDPMLLRYGLADEPQTTYDDFETAFAHYDRRVLLLGKPGAGKTTTLLHYARAAAVKRRGEVGEPLPVMANIALWDGKQTLAEWLQGSYGAPDDVAGLLERGELLLLLDGLDELGSTRIEKDEHGQERTYDPRERFIKLIPANNRVLITCRVQDYEDIGHKIDLSNALTLQSLSDEMLETALTEHPALWNAAQRDDDLRELLKTPLVMSLFAFAYDDIPAEKRRQIEDLTLAPGDVRDELVLAYIRRRYQYEEQRERMRGARLPFQLGDITKDDGAPDDDRPPLLPILGRLAMENFGRWRKEWMRLLIADDIFIFDDFDLALGDHAVMRDVLIDLLLRMDIMQGRGDDYAFLHLYLRDALAYAFSLPRLKYESLYEKMVFFDKPNPVQALVAAGGERALDPLLSILADEHEQAMIRYSAAEALGEIGGERAVDGLLAALNDDDAYVRSSAAGALGAIGDGRAVNGLLAALNDADADVRRSAAGALERIGDGRAVNGLLAALNDDAAFVRRRAAYVLGKIGDARAVDGLLAALNDDAADVRGNAAGALGAIGDARAVDGLLAALNDNDPDVGFRAAEALGAIGDERAVAGLGQLLQDTQAQGNLEDWNWWRACNAATDALRKIGTPEALRLLAENPLPPPPPPPPRPHVFISYSRW